MPAQAGTACSSNEEIMPDQTSFATCHANVGKARVHSASRTGSRDCATAQCAKCTLHPICVPEPEDAEETPRLDFNVGTTRDVKRGQTLFHFGDAFKSVYAVKTGSFKRVITQLDGREYVTGFSLAGEVMGFDAVAESKHNCTSIALEDSRVCIMPFSLLEEMCRQTPAMQHHLHRTMSYEIVRDAWLMTLLGTMTVDERLSAFLISLSKRYAQRGYSATAFNLTMSRGEIASLLGMKLETVCRALTRLREADLVTTTGRLIQIVDLPALEAHSVDRKVVRPVIHH